MEVNKMKTILYGVAGDGMGHATRAKAILDDLIKIYNVHIVAGDRAYIYLKKHFKKVYPVKTLRTHYKNNRVSAISTATVNIKSINQLIKSVFKTNNLIKKINPDLIINDFVFSLSYLSYLNKIPMITIDNQMVIIKTKYHFNLIDWWARLKSKLVCHLFVPKAKHHCIASFFFPPLRKKNVGFHFPIIRKELKELKNSIIAKGDYILVYQTTKSNKTLLNILHTLPYKFIIYGFGKDAAYKNCIYKTFKEKEFFSDLAGCNAVIANGGFSLISEALYFQKPILSIPIRQQFEQILNAQHLHSLKYGWQIKQADRSLIIGFLAYVDSNLFRSIHFEPGNKSIIQVIRNYLDRKRTKRQ